MEFDENSGIEDSYSTPQKFVEETKVFNSNGAPIPNLSPKLDFEDTKDLFFDDPPVKDVNHERTLLFPYEETHKIVLFFEVSKGFSMEMKESM